MDTAVFSLDVDAEVLVIPGGGRVRSTRFHLEERHRPRMLGEDSREEARRAVERQLVRKVAAMACRLSPKRVEKLRAGTAQPTSGDSPRGR